MANYDIPTPASLDSLDETQPLGGETGDKTDDILRQTRSLVKDVILKEHNADGTHKALTDPSVSPASITSVHIQNSSTDDGKRAVGTNAIKDSAVTTPKINDAAVTDAKLATDAVTTVKIDDTAVTAAKLATDSVETAKIVDDAVTAAKLQEDAAVSGNRAVSADHIQDGAVTTSRIAANAVTTGKMAVPAANKLLASDGVSLVECTIGGDATAVVSGSVLQISLGGGTFLARALITEPNHSGSDTDTLDPAGPPTGERRPWGTGIFNTDITRESQVTVSGQTITVQAGVYLVRFGAMAFDDAVSTKNFTKDYYHRCYLYDDTNDTTLVTGRVAHLGNMSEGFGFITLQTAVDIFMYHEDLGLTASLAVEPSVMASGVPVSGDIGSYIDIIKVDATA